jgi:Fe2+ or Zn2+ uptake regulation protein
MAERSAAKAKFLAFLDKRRLRVTSQRQAIVDTVFSTDEHFTAEQLIEWAKHRDRSVSRATVYRTLPLLTESGLVREMDFGTIPTTPTTQTTTISFAGTATRLWSSRARRLK